MFLALLNKTGVMSLKSMATSKVCKALSADFTCLVASNQTFYPSEIREPIWEFPKIRGTLFWGPYNKDPIV